MIRSEEGLDLLRSLIQIDTSNPPGNEEAAVQFIEAWLKKEGITSQIFSPAPQRGNLMARLKGKKAGEPIVLLGHIDVVPANDAGWTEPPFKGVVRNGYMYGRGAVDMKSDVAAQILAFATLKREGITPERDIILLITCDEETGGQMGVGYMLEKVDELSDAALVLSEGGCIIEEDGVLHAQVSVAEKKICQFMIRAHGTGGHGSMPHKDNANDKVVRAANRIIAHNWPIRRNKVATRYLSGILKGKKFKGFTFSTLSDALRRKSFRVFAENNLVYNALLRNTVALTILKGGVKVNVIPPESEASFDARILPEEQHEHFLAQVQKVAGKDVEVVPVDRGESIPSSYDTDFFKAIRRAVKARKGNIPVLPFITTGATDLRYFRQIGITAYGFSPMALSRAEFMSMHSIDERISVESFAEGLDATYDIVKDLATRSSAD
ncbi:MAG: M20/M25/M40 family metallo-hydrolase [Syntrophorhabdales bacterium]|jgi:acetylornithine deacetylase/succinyl-diaminopimelate desuccinylase-like protein